MMRTAWKRLADRTGRRGAMAPVFALALPMLTAAVGFAVDGASLMTAQARLQVAADAAATAASRKLSNNPSAEAIRVAALNLPVDQHGNVLSASDVSVGVWQASDGSFTVSSTNPNAVRVVTRYSAKGKNAFKPVFGSVLGISSMDVMATATALCPPNPALSQISPTIPSRTAVVTMGQNCSPESGLSGTCYWANSKGNPIIRVDNWNAGETTITIRIVSPTQYLGTFSFTAPRAGQFWVVVPQVTLGNVAQGAQSTNIVFRVESSSPAVPANRINTSGTATYNNRFNATTTLPGTALCSTSGQSAASRLVG